MKLQYLGTAAAEGWPGIFCRCENCAKAYDAGGRNIRSRSQACIDGKLLIDFPPDTFHHMISHRVDLSTISDVIVTHSHMDHFFPDDFWCRNKFISFNVDPEVPVLTVHGGEAVGRLFASRGGVKPERAVFSPIEKYAPKQIGSYTVIGMSADHDQNASPMIYVISDGEKTILYAHDTGYFLDDVWQYIAEHRLRFDLVSLDCTNVILGGEHDANHMGVKTDRKVKERLLESGAADGSTIFVLNHFSHNGKLMYDELVEYVGDEFVVSYDGMTVEI